jgi:hypothetical protein
MVTINIDLSLIVYNVKASVIPKIDPVPSRIRDLAILKIVHLIKLHTVHTSTGD